MRTELLPTKTYHAKYFYCPKNMINKLKAKTKLKNPFPMGE